MSQQLTVGRIVHYRLPYSGTYADVEAWRPAIVTNAFPGSAHANMRVLLDPANDLRPEYGLEAAVKGVGADLEGIDLNAYSATEGTGPGNWRWPPRA